MQPSELWRRGVVLPLTGEAVAQIDAWSVDHATAVEYLPMDSPIFSELNALGLFVGVNQACDSLIDDYESEWLQPHQLPAAEKAVRAWLLKWPGGESGLFTERLLALIGRAREMGRPLYFEC